MPSVPTSTITHSNPRLSLTNGQAKPCRSKARRPWNAGFAQNYLLQQSPARPESLTQARKNKLADLDFPIGAVTPTPRLG